MTKRKKRGMAEKPPQRELLPLKSRRKVIAGLIDDRDRPDELSDGYFCVPREDGSFRSLQDHVLRVEDDSLCYNGARQVLFVRKGVITDPHTPIKTVWPVEAKRLTQQANAVPLWVIPVNYFTRNASKLYGTDPEYSTTLSDREKLAFHERDVMGRYPVQFPASDADPVWQAFMKGLRKHGHSNAFLACDEARAADCFRRSTILAARLRAEGISARIVGSVVSPQTWSSFCESMGSFRAEFPEGVYPEYIAHIVRAQGGGGRGFMSMFRARSVIDDFRTGQRLASLDPSDRVLYDLYKTHFWVQALIDGSWTTHNTTRVLGGEIDQLRSTLFSYVQPSAVNASEIRLCRDSDGAGVLAREKNI